MVGWGGGYFVCISQQETRNLKMNLLDKANTQPRKSWFDFPIPEDFGTGLRGILGYLFVTRIDLLSVF